MNKKISWIAVLSITAMSVACSDREPTSVVDDPALAGLVISNPLSQAVNARVNLSFASVSAASAGVVYMSLAPGTAPNADKAEIYNRTLRGPSTVVSLTNGGFDPVPIFGNAGDIIEMKFWSSGRISNPMSVKVPARRNPGVVRTSPSKGRIDVALSVTITVIFTEPVDPASVTSSSVRLLQNETAVAGTLTVASDGLSADFTPAAPLEPGWSYEVKVSSAVHDLDGDGLDPEYSVSFMTGAPIATGGCPGYSDPTHCPPFGTGGALFVDGTVKEHRVDGDYPVENPTVYAWVQRTSDGYQRGATSGGLDGRFHITALPEALIVLTPLTQLDYPCAAHITLPSSNPTADIELISPQTPMPERAVKPPVLTGVVYETVDGARRPLAGARVYFEAMMDLPTAWTTTDANGRFALCNLVALWSQQTVYVSSSSFPLAERTVSITPDVTQLDIEMKK